MSDSREPDNDKTPDDDELKEPSTEKEPGEQLTDGDSTPEEVDHKAVGIGVVEDASDDDHRSDREASPPHPTAAETATSDSAPPTDAASDEVRSDAAGIEEPDEREQDPGGHRRE